MMKNADSSDDLNTYYDDYDDADISGENKQSAGNKKRSRYKKKTNALFFLLLLIFLTMFVSSAVILFQRVISDSRSEEGVKNLESKITEVIPKQDTSGSQSVIDYRGRYQALIDENPDFIGWIKIPDTKVDLPVVWRKGDNVFYLKHGFDLKESVYGVPFLDEKCDPDPSSDCNNYIIYGHHMKTGTVFAGLVKYEDQDYLEQHPEITFNTIYEDGTYEIFGAFAVDVTRDKTFKYYEDTAMNEEDFNTFISEIKKRSVIKSDITPKYGDRILTLSTCEYSTSDGRFVLFGVKKDDGQNENQ